MDYSFVIWWAFFAIGGGAINAMKGKSLVWGLAGGAVFGIFGWAYLALHNPGIPCSKCREKVKTGATVCRHCGAQFSFPVGTAG